MITNASDSPISVCNLPNVQDVLSGWFQKMTMSVLTKAVVNFKLVETSNSFEIMAVRQPFTTKQLMIKPEGQRAWQWETLHMKGTDYEPCLDDVVLFGTKRYRIMQKFEWSQYGYLEIQMIEDFGVSRTELLGDNVSITESDPIGT